MIRIAQRCALLFLSALLLTSVVPPAPAAAAEPQVQRLAGTDRYATAAAISQARFPSGASTVFVATGASFPDALAAAPAAARAKAPILLAQRGEVPAATARELDRLNPTRIVVLGGSSAISDATLAKLKAYAGEVVRWAGADRYATAAAISARTFGAGVPVTYVATGRNFPDALAGGAAAARAGGPILLVANDAIPASTRTELARLKPGRIVVLGGSGAVSEAVRVALDRYTSGSVTRIAGGDRYGTAVKASQSTYGASASAVIATGANFPDGLAGGPVAALLPGPLLLVSRTQLPAAVGSELQRLGATRILVLGGSAVISNGVVDAITRTVAGPSPIRVTVGQGIWISQSELMSLPTSGRAWERLVSRANSTIPRDDLSCQDATAPAITMAAALVAARTNDDRLRDKVRDELLRIRGTEAGTTCGHPDRNRPLGVGRNLAAYVISADLIGFRSFDPTGEKGWRDWLSRLRSTPLPGGWALNSLDARGDHSNWGAHQAAALTAADAYLGDTAALAVDAAWARAWVDPGAAKAWIYHTAKHDYSWSATGVPPAAPVNPAGAVKQGVTVDGIPLVDMQRGGGFTTGKPILTNYPRESLVGRTVQFEILARAGYPAYEWGDRGLLRIARRLLALSRQWESGWYEPRMNAYWILEARYGAGLPLEEGAVGRQVTGVDWTHR